jgi:hypothetical protein
MAGEITLQQLFQKETITKVVSRFKTPLSLLQNFYGLQVGGSAAENQSGRNIGWDIYDSTRMIARVRAPDAPPSTRTQKAVGHVSAQTIRFHEKIVIRQDQVARMRPLGAQVGTVDGNGMAYVRRQLEFGTKLFRNAREWMVSRMFRGGWGYTYSGDDWYLTEHGSGLVNVDLQMPDSHKDYLELGSGANIITSSWEDPATQVISQILGINRAFERLQGRPMRHIWINSITFSWLLLNTELQAVGGSAYRIFDSMTGREVKSEEGIPDTGFDVKFRALPFWTFHVYDGVLATPTSQTDSTDASAVESIIPNNKAIFTPEPDADWLGMVNGSEYIAENLMDEGREVFGFHNWTTRCIDPAGWEVKLLDNCLPALYIPKAVAYGTVGGF